MERRQELELLFHNEMLNVYQLAKSEAGYNATRFLQMVAEHGGLEAAHRLLAGERFQEGLDALALRGRLDISMEKLVLDPRFSSLFSEAELETARRRLLAYGYQP